LPDAIWLVLTPKKTGMRGQTVGTVVGGKDWAWPFPPKVRLTMSLFYGKAGG
jgi:hypothetical protein